MSKKWILSFVLFIILISILSINNYREREYDWDMPGYLSSLLVMNGIHDTAEIHKQTYSLIKRESTDAQYRTLTSEDDPQKAIYHFAKNANFFVEQLPYYQVKVGYLYFIKFFNILGFREPMSILMVSLVSFLLSGLLIFYYLKLVVPHKPLLVLGISGLIMLFPYFHFMATITTPDMLGIVLLLVFITLLTKQSKTNVLFVVLLLLVFCRPDFLVFALTYLFAEFLFALFKLRIFRYELLLQGLVLIFMYFSIVTYYNYPSWSDVFYDSFINRRYSIAAEPISINFSEYKNVVLSNIINFKKVSLAAIILLSLILFYSKKTYHIVIGFLLFINIYLKFLVFPAPGELRFFVGYLLLMILWLVYIIMCKTNSRNFLTFTKQS